jgi:dTMP kinase
MKEPFEFTKNPYTGFFIDLEGLDGSGKSTQARILKSNLISKGFKVFSTKEPTTGIIGKLIKKSLIHQIHFSSSTLQLLFTADRIEHLKNEIIPALEKSKIVITERYFWSTVAFGGINLDKNWLLNLNKFCIVPDLTIFLDVPAKTCVKRLIARNNLELFEKEKTLIAVRKNYHWLIKQFPSRIKTTNGNLKIEVVSQNLLKEVLKNNKIKRLK